MSSFPKTHVNKQMIEKKMSNLIEKNFPANASVMGSDLTAATKHEGTSFALVYSVGKPIGVSNAKRDALVQKLQNKVYRDAYVQSTIFQGLAHQIRVNRELRGLSQAALAEKCGRKTTQVTISRLEDPAYGRLTLNTALKVASALDVAMVVKFVPYSKFILETADKSAAGLFAKSFTDENLYTRQAMVTISAEIPPQKSVYLTNELSNKGISFMKPFARKVVDSEYRLITVE